MVRKPAHERIAERITVDEKTGCWLFQGCVDKFGYGKISAPHGGFERTHRVMYSAHVSPIPSGMCVMHRCDVPNCCNPSHLTLGTKAENNADKAAKDRARRKLTAGDVNSIRLLSGTHQSIADRYGVSRSMVTHIKNGTQRTFV